MISIFNMHKSLFIFIDKECTIMDKETNWEFTAFLLLPIQERGGLYMNIAQNTIYRDFR